MISPSVSTSCASRWKSSGTCSARRTPRGSPHGPTRPTLRATIVFVSTHGHSAAQAANIAMSLGFQRCAVIEAASPRRAPRAPLRPVHPDGTRRRHTRIRRHAVRQHPRCQRRFRRVQILAPGPAVDNPARRDPVPRRVTAPPKYGAAQGAALVTLIDVRRHDERALYGAIRGSVHLPAEQIPRALLMTPEDWLRAFHFRKPGADEVGVVYSRRQERASYAKQLFGDAGVHRCLVLGEGVMGWRNGNEGDVRAYDAYAEGERRRTASGGVAADADRPAAGRAHAQERAAAVGQTVSCRPRETTRAGGVYGRCACHSIRQRVLAMFRVQKCGRGFPAACLLLRKPLALLSRLS